MRNSTRLIVATVVILAVALVIANWARAEEPRMVAEQQVRIERIAAPVDAATLAVADLNSLSSLDQPFVRYIWIPPWISNGYAIAGQFLNEVFSRSAQIIPPYLISRDGVSIVRVDVRQYAPDPKDQRDLLKVWDKLETVYFPFKQASLDTTQGIDQFVDVDFSDRGRDIQVRCKVLEADATRYRVQVPDRDARWIPRQHCHAVQPTVATLTNLQLAPLGVEAQKLPGLTRSQVPIVRLDELVRQGYTSLDNNKFAGLYYEFIGIDKLSLDQLLRLLGADPQATNITRLPIIRSDVTGRPRITDIFYGTKVRPDAGTPLVIITLDTLEQDRGVNWQDDLDTFLKAAVAHEVIFTRTNGTNGYAIYAAQQQLDAVPDFVAANHKVPPPHNSQLAAGLGCVYCHADPNHTSGYVRHGNDLRELLAGSPEFKSFIEGQQLLGIGNQAALDNIQQLQGQKAKLKAALARHGVRATTADVDNVLAGDFRQLETIVSQFFSYDSYVLQKAQQDYARNIRRATYNDVQVAAHSTIVMWNNYEHALITPQVALRDLGYRVSGGVPSALALQRVFGLPIGYEDPVFASLKVMKGTDRGTWEAKYPLAAQRAVGSLMLKPTKGN